MAVSDLEYRLTSTAKTIVYLFSPDVDLLEQLEHNIQHYHHFKKTKLILRELVNSVSGDQSGAEMDLVRTKEQIVNI